MGEEVGAGRPQHGYDELGNFVAKQKVHAEAAHEPAELVARVEPAVDHAGAQTRDQVQAKNGEEPEAQELEKGGAEDFVKWVVLVDDLHFGIGRDAGHVHQAAAGAKLENRIGFAGERGQGVNAGEKTGVKLAAHEASRGADQVSVEVELVTVVHAGEKKPVSG